MKSVVYLWFYFLVVLSVPSLAFVGPNVGGSRNHNHNRLSTTTTTTPTSSSSSSPTALFNLSKKRRDQLGVGDDEDEYDLGVALETNTDPLISKIVAGSFIVVLTALLIVGIVLPSLTDYGEGVCNPILTQGRC